MFVLGKSMRRNSILTEHVSQILPYRGLDGGIRRALQAWPGTNLVDEGAVRELAKPLRKWPPSHRGSRTTARGASEAKRSEMQQALDLRDREHFLENDRSRLLAKK